MPQRTRASCTLVPAWTTTGSSWPMCRWRHPNMPWDSSQLVVARLAADGRSVLSRQVVAGGDGGGGVGGESVMTPTWHTPSSATVNGKNSGGYGEEEGGGGDEDSHLFFISDRADGFWAIHRVTISRSPEDAPSSSGAFTVGTIQCVLKCSGYEFGAPQWVFGVHSFRQLPDGRLVTFWTPPTLTPPYAADNSDAKSSAALMDADADATETTGARGRASADANQLYAVVFDGFHSEPFDLSHFDLASLASLPGLHVIPVPGIASPSPGAAGNSGTPTDRTIGIDSVRQLKLARSRLCATSQYTPTQAHCTSSAAVPQSLLVSSSGRQGGGSPIHRGALLHHMGYGMGSHNCNSSSDCFGACAAPAACASTLPSCRARRESYSPQRSVASQHRRTACTTRPATQPYSQAVHPPPCRHHRRHRC